MSDERRKYKRVKNQYEVKIKISKDNKHDTGKSVNMSACGVLIKSNKPFDVGALINARFINPESKDIFESTAKVIRVEMNADNKTYDIGIEFIDLNDEEEKNLNHFLLSSEQEEEQTDEDNCYYIEIEIPEEFSE